MSTRFLQLLLLFVTLLASVSNQAKATSPTESNGHGDSYLVQFIDFKILNKSNPKDIVAAWEGSVKEGKVEVVESLQLSAQNSIESFVQVGRSVPMSMGTMQNPVGRTTTRSFSMQQIGTSVNLTLTTFDQSASVSMEFSYEASRLGPKGDDDAPSTITQVRHKTTLPFELGRPTLIGGSSNGEGCYLLVLITKK